MSFKTTVGFGVSAAILLIVYQALGVIVAGVIVAAQVAFWWVIIVGTGGALFVGWTYYQREADARNRYIDGQAPLLRVRKPGGGYTIVDMNKAMSAIVDVGRDGVEERTPAAGWEMQQQHNAVVQMTRSLAAIIPGDAAQVRTHGAISAPKLGEAVTRLLTKAPSPVPAQAPTIVSQNVPQIVQRQPVTGQQMIANPQPTRLAIGESVESGEIVYWDVVNVPFVRVHGVTGGGKTALGKMLVAQAIRHGWEVTILDTRQGKDWGIFRNHARLVDARQPETALEEIRREVARYEQRDSVLGQHQAADIQELGRITGKSYRRRLFVVEEVQSHHINAEDLGQEWKLNFWRSLGKLTKDARATGIHGLYIDQMPTEWSKGVRYNSESICFRLPDYGGRVAGYLYAHQLEKYHCHYDGQIIKAGYLTEAQILATIGNAPAKRAFSGQNDTQRAGSVAEPAQNTEQNQPTELSPTEYQERAAAMIAKNPNTRQVDLIDELHIVKSYANKLWHTYHPNGALYKPPTLPTEEK